MDVVADEMLVMERFRLLERIGSGGMGTVYRAFDERLQREVAVKEITAADPARVLREAQAAARLNHPGIVTLYELGQANGSALLVSELVPGETLAELQRRGALSDRDLGEIAADLCAALAHAHERDVVHRDLKPQNVIVRGDAGVPGAAKLLDFGIARVAGSPTLTEAGEVIGTLAYMAPEQAEGRLAGPESDVYSLALTLYECFTGANPVLEASPAATARRIGQGVPPLRDSRPDLPEGLADLIDACLDADPDLRPTAAQLGECVEVELAALDPGSRLPLPEADGDEEARPRGGPALGRLATIVALCGLVTVLAGPLGAGGAALVAAVLVAPLLAIGAPREALLTPLAPLLGGIGLGGAATALGAAGRSSVDRAVIGATAWAWILVIATTTGFGPDLGFAGDAASGWAADASVAADSVGGALLAPQSLLAAGTFALAAVTLGWILAVRHASVSLLLAMVWAAVVAATLNVVADGLAGGRPLAVIAAAVTAVAIEFGLARPSHPLARHPRRRDSELELAGAKLSERLA